MQENETAVAGKDENSVEFMPFGATDKIRLTASMVRQFIAVPTKSGALPTERDCIRFIMLCRGKRANPFEGDCFLIGYDSQTGPTFSLVCGLELFEKRSSTEESYDGTESGVIIQTEEKAIIDRPGTLVLGGENLVGGWAKVHRKDRALPEYKSVVFSTYNTGRSRWMKDPGGMIMKVARSQALRAAFPTALGGLYTQEEMQKVTEIGEDTARAPVSMPRRLSETATVTVEPEPAPPAPPAPPIKEKRKSQATPPADDRPPDNVPPDVDPQAGAPDGETRISGVIKVVTRKPGTSKKGDFVKCGICLITSTGEVWVNTFDTTLADEAEKAKGQEADMLAKPGKYGLDLIDFGLPDDA